MRTVYVTAKLIAEIEKPSRLFDRVAVFEDFDEAEALVRGWILSDEESAFRTRLCGVRETLRRKLLRDASEAHGVPPAPDSRVYGEHEARLLADFGLPENLRAIDAFLQSEAGLQAVAERVRAAWTPTFAAASPLWWEDEGIGYYRIFTRTVKYEFDPPRDVVWVGGTYRTSAENYGEDVFLWVFGRPLEARDEAVEYLIRNAVAVKQAIAWFTVDDLRDASTAAASGMPSRASGSSPLKNATLARAGCGDDAQALEEWLASDDCRVFFESMARHELDVELAGMTAARWEYYGCRNFQISPRRIQPKKESPCSS